MVSEFSIDWNGWRYQVAGQNLRAFHNDELQAQFDLSPIVEGRKTTITRWSEEPDGRFRGTLSEGGVVLLQVREGHLAYWMETEIPHFELLTFFPDTTFKGDAWQTYVSDGHDRMWEKSLDAEVLISSAYDNILNPDSDDLGGLNDPGDFPCTFIWNMPARAWSFKAEDGWLGFSIPGPLPVGVTRLKMNRQKFSLTFQVLHPAGPDGSMPVVYFVTGLNGAYDVLDEDRAISDRLGLTVKKSPDHPAWWGGPGFKAALEQGRLWKEKELAGEKDIDFRKFISREDLVNWIHTVKRDLGVNEMFAILEQGAYICYGDYRPTDWLGGIEGFREMVDELRRENMHMCFYIHPYMFNTILDFYKEHPEAFCQPKDKGHHTRYALDYGYSNPEFALIDWTHPLGRDYILSQVEMLLSDKPGCMNCDWLRSNHWRSPDPRVYDFHDPDWGIGDLMTMKVQKLLYEKAKSIKPYACVSKAGLGAPYMQPYADVDLLAEDWSGFTDTWYKRGRIITRLVKDMLFLTDPYFVTISKSYEYYMGMASWCMIEDPIVKHAIHP